MLTSSSVKSRGDGGRPHSAAEARGLLALGVRRDERATHGCPEPPSPGVEGFSISG